MSQIMEVQRLLREGGWPIEVSGERDPKTNQAIRDFKRGYAFRPFFVSFGAAAGPVFRGRLRKSVRLGGACSKHFKFREFASSHSGWIRTHRNLVRGLERVRK